jgi:hypothetical protein
VVWGLPDGARRDDPIVGPLIRPLTGAGFTVTRVVTPCNALGALARLRAAQSGGVKCWVGVNRGGVAIVVVRPGKLLYSHAFTWDSTVGASGSQARLLQRYSLVAHLAPEVRRALAAARQKGSTVDGLVTCGSLPDLRALTRPLIEELDLEVETLDSLEGITATPDTADLLADAAASLRIACAATFARETRSVDEVKRRRAQQSTRTGRVLRVALVIALLLVAAAWYYFRLSGAAVRRSAVAVQLSAAGSEPASSAQPPSSALRASEARPAASSQSTASANSPASSLEPPASALRASEAKPASSAPPASAPRASASSPASSLEPPTSGRQPPISDLRPPSSALRASEGRPASGLSQPPRVADKPVATPTVAAIPPPRGSSSAQVSEVRPPAGPRPMPQPLTDAVPRVTAILVSAERRVATIGDDRRVVTVGDTVGRRVVVAIDERTIVLREPSGVQIRVALGGRIVSVERRDR